MKSKNPLDDVDDLLARMRNVREAGDHHVGDLQVEARKLSDWREYVRSWPLMSVAIATTVGFSAARNAANAVAQNGDTGAKPVFVASTTIPRGPHWTSPAYDLAKGLVLSSIKQYLSTLVQRLATKEDSHDRSRNGTTTQQPSNSDGSKL